jgi:hypothetical protein
MSVYSRQRIYSASRSGVRAVEAEQGTGVIRREPDGHLSAVVRVVFGQGKDAPHRGTGLVIELRFGQNPTPPSCRHGVAAYLARDGSEARHRQRSGRPPRGGPHSTFAQGAKDSLAAAVVEGRLLLPHPLLPLMILDDGKGG